MAEPEDLRGSSADGGPDWVAEVARLPGPALDAELGGRVRRAGRAAFRREARLVGHPAASALARAWTFAEPVVLAAVVLLYLAWASQTLDLLCG